MLVLLDLLELVINDGEFVNLSMTQLAKTVEKVNLYTNLVDGKQAIRLRKTKVSWFTTLS